MGNRAVIATKADSGVGIYVHWNGGRDSVVGFLTYCKLQGFRCPENDCYGWARLAQVIGNYFGGDGLSVGIDTVDHLDCDNYDNGMYIIKNWQIVDRKYFEGDEQVQYSIEEMLKDIDEQQPKEMQLGENLLPKLKELRTKRDGSIDAFIK